MFEIKEKDMLGRIGVLSTPHGKVETPLLMPVINPNRLILSPQKIESMGAKMLITNAYIIYRSPELRGRTRDVGIHGLLGFDGPIMTDSGSYQLSVYGDVHIENNEIVNFQLEIGSDVVVPVDIPTPPNASRERTAREMHITEENIKEARRLVDGCGRDVLLAAPVQGSTHPHLRYEAAVALSHLGDVFPIGAVVPLMERYEFDALANLIVHSKMGLAPCAPVHLFGAGHPMMLALAVALGCDMFDSAAYALYAAEGKYMSVHGTRRLSSMRELPCSCPVCTAYTPQELANDERSEELLAEHNLYAALTELKLIRESIREGRLAELVQQRCRAHPAMLDAYRAALSHSSYIEEVAPQPRAPFFYSGPECVSRPEVIRHKRRLLHIELGERCLVYTGRHRRANSSHYDTVCRLVSPFGPYPVELGETFPVNTVSIEGDVEAKLSALEALQALIEANPKCNFDIELDGRWYGPPLLPIIDRLKGFNNVASISKVEGNSWRSRVERV
ncbi:MAG: tRNA guanosine(15) transglycosylase TgtA [Methermicoccaceae archaeon]